MEQDPEAPSTLPHKCRPVTLDFINTAPYRFINICELDAPPDKVFAILEDGPSWVLWFKEIETVRWTR